jgi:hypothetical protein
MNRNSTLAARLQEVLLDGTWIANTNYATLLRQTNWREATRKVGTCNTIAALTFHINYYLDGLLRAFATGHLDISDRYSFDIGPIDNESDWQALVNTFISNAQTFVQYVAQCSDSDLEGPFINADYGTLARNIEGVIEHSYYHMGQISLLKKLLVGA